jgi:integrase
MSRSPKGSVTANVRDGRLRLRLPRQAFGGKQKYLTIGPDSPENRRIAEARVKQIEADLLLGQFDQSLAKYSPRYQPPPQQPSICQLWQEYSAFKSKHLAPNSLKDLRRVEGHLKGLPYQSLDRAKAIARYASEELSQDAARRLLMQLQACCDWAVANDLIDSNPFEGLGLKRVRQRNINPFTKEERDLILTAFSQTKHRHYHAYASFLFFTGCRPSEAAALQWQHIDAALTTITFCESLSEDGTRKTTKTGNLRRFPVNEQLQYVIKSCPYEGQGSSLFRDRKGGSVRPHNFTNREWKPLLKELPMLYRPPYNTRHTFCTLCLDAGIPVAQVAAWVGNSPKVLLDHYAGLTRSAVPEL